MVKRRNVYTRGQERCVKWTFQSFVFILPLLCYHKRFVFRVRHYCILQSLDFFSREAGISGNQFGGKSVALHPLSGLYHILVNGSFLHYNDILFPTERFLTLLCRARLCLFINPINTLYARHLIKVLGIVRDNS